MSQGQEIQLLDVRQHQSLLGRQEEQLNKWCAGTEVRGEMLIRYALAEMQTSNDLRNCTPTSIYLALLACAVTGLPPGKLKGYSFLVPFRDGDVSNATFMMGWRGVKHIGYRSGLDLVSAVIHDGDDFDFDKGTTPFVRYKPALKGAGQVIGTAAWAKLPRGGLEIEYMNKDELEKVKQAASRLRKSPAWDGPFRDQMERKTALKRLGKQIEMGEEFFRANAIEDAGEEHGSQTSAIDQLTDGAASQFLGKQSTEAAAFGALPRPAQAQVPAQAASKPPKDKPIDAKATERPTSGAGSAAGAASGSKPAPAPSVSTTPAAASSKSSTGGSEGSNPTAATAGGPSAASASPAVAGANSTAAAGSSSTSPAPASTQTPSGASTDDAGDVAGEPAEGDAFDTSFGEAEGAEPAGDAKPVSFGDWSNTWDRWVTNVSTRDQARADTAWRDLFRGWLAVCKTKQEADDAKTVVAGWAGKIFSLGKKGEPKTRDPEITEMQTMYAHRVKELP